MPADSPARVVWLSILEQGFWTSVLAGISAVPAGLAFGDGTAQSVGIAIGTGAFGGLLGWVSKFAQWRLTLIDTPWARRLAVK